MDFSIIIPVFNKADLTRRCLETLLSSIADAGEGEVIVVDNGSSDHTARVLAEFPWIRLIQNEKNLGFAAANNQAARVATGDFLVLLNNDTEPWPGWLGVMLATARQERVGAVGARLLYPDKKCQHGGVVVIGNPFGRQDAQPFHHNFMVPFEDADVRRTQDVQIVTGACLVTPRALYEKLGGLDEGYWNGFEDVDYCLKVRREGLRVVYEANAVLYHFESQSGIQRFRRSAWNTELLERRWRGTFYMDALEKNIERQLIRHPLRNSRTGLNSMIVAAPGASVIVHGSEPPHGRAAFEESIRANYSPVNDIVYALGEDGLSVAREAMRIRGLHYAAFVHGNAILEPRWLDELFRQVTATPTAIAATYSPDLPLGENVAALAGDGRCTLLSLFAIPLHLKLANFDSIEGSVADLLLRLLPLGYGTRGAGRAIAKLPPLPIDRAFQEKHHRSLAELADTDPLAMENLIAKPLKRERGLVSIVTLSWNAPQYTKLALDSIARHTSEPYEVIVVDNGSGQDTVRMLQEIADPHVRIIYNATNRGFGGGNNDGIAAARGDFIVVLNNDVIVTDRWLDALLDPFNRIPSLGMTAPRTNKIIGDQEVIDANYSDDAGMHAYAADRAVVHAKRGFLTDRAIGFCLCIDRRVIDEIGGFDERFAVGNFEDDDFSIRVRAAGYEIYVCDDSFIHHFGSQSFKANNVDYMATMQGNWTKFATKWGYGSAYPTNGYDPRKAIVQGFDREKHFAPLPPVRAEAPAKDVPGAEIVFVAEVHDEKSWTKTAEFLRRYLQAFDAASNVSFMIAAAGAPDAARIGKRAEKLLEKLGISDAECADVTISDEDDLSSWRSTIVAREIIDACAITDRSPSALRRLVEGRA